MTAKFTFNPSGTAATVQGGWFVVDVEPRRSIAEINYEGQTYLLTVAGRGLRLEPFPKPRAAEPPPFNPEYRPGLAEALDKAYTAHCDAYPDLTQDELAACYLQIHANLIPQFPQVNP